MKERKTYEENVRKKKERKSCKENKRKKERKKERVVKKT